MKNKFQKTITASFVGYIVQAIANTFVPLLFVTFQNTYGIPIEKITLLISINFILQLFTDIAATFLVDKLGYRKCVVAAHFFAATGLILLAVLPERFNDPYLGLIISVLFYAVGGGLIEVVISPIVESCPSEHKDKTMSLLHSFYCWGSMGVITLSALFFFTIGIEYWKILSLIWAIIPIVNGITFLFVPLQNIIKEGESGLKIIELFKNKLFWLFSVVILCAGASEAAVAQWASTFVENSLGLPKALGDLVGPALFAATMGICRVIYGKQNNKLNLEKAMALSGMLCIISYLIIVFVPIPVVSLIGMALCGFSVGLMWPGTYSLAVAKIKGGGNAMFALLALSGDLGCVSGPAVVGLLSDALGGGLKTGILFAIVFPIVLTVCITLWLVNKRKTQTERV